MTEQRRKGLASFAGRAQVPTQSVDVNNIKKTEATTSKNKKTETPITTIKVEVTGRDKVNAVKTLLSLNSASDAIHVMYDTYYNQLSSEDKKFIDRILGKD